ncbi:MAG TPA: carboxyl transferase domain-containing protein, partial [Spirochaetia bacterium]|nr:carboxyl transferase domain-containing protein [Spirochaetia bacterium]
SAAWPGWGFLSEDADFVAKLEEEGILFLGPSSKAMSQLGDKIEAKELAESAEVPILPWSRGALADVDAAYAMADKLGYPVIIKAANAGGGRGIRFVRTKEELASQFKSARDETVRITGNDVVFMELLVERGRHLEVQVLADSRGNVNTFGVRDCSVQRRNQKIIEETPPPNFAQETIAEMEASAARLIRRAEYVGAGTVEYLYDLNRRQFYFMEVNTRLQVEHPITETLYQIDLVKGQIDVARGLVVDLSDRKPNGSVIEVRLNAEDPDREFSPSPGRVSLLKIPAGPGIRVDSGIEQGSTIPSEFDSMIAKVIAFSPNRAETIARLRRALLELRIRIDNGTTNKAFLLELLANQEVRDGGVDTAFVERFLKQRRREPDDEAVRVALLAGAIELSFSQYSEDFLNFRDQLSKSGRPRNLPKSAGYEVNIAAFGQTYALTVKAVGNDVYHVGIGELVVACKYLLRDEERVLMIDGVRHNVLMVPRGDVLQCEVDGIPIPLASDSGGHVRSPSPAIVLSVNVQPDQRVIKGQVLVVLEAMKMEMIVEAPSDGLVREVVVTAGEQVAAGQPLVQLDAGSEDEPAAADATPGREPVVLSSGAPTVETEWELCRLEFLALFYGYDCGKEVATQLDRALSIAAENSQLKEASVEMLLRALEAHVAVEALFAQVEIESTLFARPMSHQELLSHYFRRGTDREKGLPQEFLTLLNRAFDMYPQVGFSSADDWQSRALFYMYRSHGRVNQKHDILRRLLFSLEDLGVPRTMHARLSQAIDELVELSQSIDASVSDAALHVRYQIIDQIRLRLLKERQHRAIERLIDQIVGKTSSSDDPELLRKEVVDAGPAIVRDLVRRAVTEDENAKRVAIELIGRRMNRDREIVSERFRFVDGFPVSWVQSKDGGNRFDTVVIIMEESRLRALRSLKPFLEWTGVKDNAFELLCLAYREAPQIELEEVVPPAELLPADSGNITWMCIGIYPTIGTAAYRTFEPAEGSWNEIVLRRAFSPRLFRELRVYRLRDFELQILYRSENVVLLQGKARQNPRDERLFALCSVSEHEPEYTTNRGITRMIMLEAVFTEAIHAMRAAQARLKYRLQWNRIIVHNRSLLAIRLLQLRDYGLRLVNRTRDLGIERLVVYSRRKRWNEDIERELELMFMNVSEDQFSLRSRRPSQEPLTTQDRYVTKVVRARQRKTVYPYEFIKMLTYSGFPLFDELPRGEFEEYDIKVNRDGGQSLVSAKSRQPGENQSNIVFGIITNYDQFFPFPLKRVIILSDPTTDLGSLAEPECRRINAALDLAERESLPVEWVPISSGAKITMDSGTENLDWTAATLKRIIQFTQNGGEINIVVPGVNVGAQSYWNAEATMLMHTRGLLVMTEDGAMLLTGKKALEFSGGVSGETNLDIGGVEKIMGPNGQAQVRVPNLAAAYKVLFRHYRYTYVQKGSVFPAARKTDDPVNRSISPTPYEDHLDQGFKTIGDIFDREKNPERKKPFDVRQVMKAVIDTDAGFFERWRSMQDADTAIVWETRVGGYSVGMIGIESRNIQRIGSVPIDGPETWSGGTLFPLSSKKVARGINACSGHLPVVILANLSGFDGSPESLRNLQLEYGAEIGRAVVNFKGPIVFVVIARYHGGAYVVFSRTLNSNLKAAALEGSFASVIGGAPAAAVVFPKAVLNQTYGDPRIIEAQERLNREECSQKEFDDLFHKVNNEKQTALGQEFDRIHSVERALRVGSIDEIISAEELRPYVIRSVESGMKSYAGRRRIR